MSTPSGDSKSPSFLDAFRTLDQPQTLVLGAIERNETAGYLGPDTLVSFMKQFPRKEIDFLNESVDSFATNSGWNSSEQGHSLALKQAFDLCKESKNCEVIFHHTDGTVHGQTRETAPDDLLILNLAAHSGTAMALTRTGQRTLWDVVTSVLKDWCKVAVETVEVTENDDKVKTFCFSLDNAEGLTTADQKSSVSAENEESLPLPPDDSRVYDALYRAGLTLNLGRSAGFSVHSNRSKEMTKDRIRQLDSDRDRTKLRLYIEAHPKDTADCAVSSPSPA